MTTGDEIRRTRVAVLIILGDAEGRLVITGRFAVILIQRGALHPRSIPQLAK